MLLPAVLSLPLLAATEASAAVTYNVRGTVTCPGGYPVSGVYLHSSGGGSAFASWTAYPGASNIARFSKSFSTRLSTTIYFSVGCGRGSAPGSWKTSNASPKVTVSSGSIYYTNAECNARGTCSYFPMEDNRPAAPSTNVVKDRTQCTYRAGEFWKLMTKRYPNWGGNGGYWDDNAKAVGWSVRAWPRINSLFVKQPTSSNPAGHVGYVADVRVYNGALQMKIYDRNYDFRGSDRNGTWIAWTSSMRFIVPPGRAGELR
ncbi:CHAP domain-containing protein [Actinophytocola sp. KF-1]